MELQEKRETIYKNVSLALEEDLGHGDLTSLLIDEGTDASATIISRSDCTLCGSAWAAETFHQLNPNTEIKWTARDGDVLNQNSTICQIKGNARTILTGERTALNFLQALSGIATKTRSYVKAVSHTRAEILDTRKTLPGLRLASKYAVQTGGGVNHRIGLFDGVLIKENHIMAAGGTEQALAEAFSVSEDKLVQIEVESIDQMEIAIEAGAKLILLDNFSLEQTTAAVIKNKGRAKLEASGGIDLESVVKIAETGVDRISIGTLTKDIKAVDLSLRIQLIGNTR